MFKKLDQNFLNKNYTEFIIDTSSLIYLYKIELLELVIKKFHIVLTKQIVDEINNDRDLLYKKLTDSANIRIVRIAERELKLFFNSIDKTLYSKLTKADRSIIVIADKLNFPVITEDKKIMKFLDDLNYRFLNSLLLIFFMVKYKILTKKDGISNIFKLSKIGWYSDEVFDLVFNLIVNFKN